MHSRSYTSRWTALIGFFPFVIGSLAAPPVVAAEDRPATQTTAPIMLQPADRIAILGGGLAERMQHDGWMETLLQHRFTDHQLVFRNLGFNGDELTIRMRSEGFGSPEDWLKRTQASVIFAMFGYNESFAGDEGLAKFREDITKFIQNSRSQAFDGQTPPRIVLFSPIAHENLDSRVLPDGAAINGRLEAYTAAMKQVAEQQGVGFVDLFHPTLRLYEAMPERLTINGVHLNERGNFEVAKIIAQSIAPSDAAVDIEDLASLRAAVQDKNFHWFHRYRTTDGFSTFGGRKGAGASQWTPRNEEVLKRELAILDVMTANRDQRIWGAARGEEIAIDDSNTPDFVPVATNKPGPLATGDYPFLGGEEAIGRMTVAKGMRVNLFASEEEFPDLRNPVQMAVDPQGRLWVAVWPSYPHWIPKDPMNDKLLILEDTNGDGRADKCQTFADGLHNPTGFEFYNGGIYVAQVPDIWFLKDTDGDDVADVRMRVLGGIDSADTHHSINSFVVGSGGGIYFAEGIFHRTQVETPHGPPVRVANGGVYRYDPKTQRLDVHSAYSFPNPHGHVFDYWGMNIVHDGTGARPYFGPAFSGHVNYPQRHPSAPQVYQQRTRPCAGTAILSSTHFPEANRDTLLACNVIGFQGVLQYQLESDGSGLTATEIEPIVSSSDPNFRPSDIEIGGDGAIYVSDWQNPLIGHLQHNLRDANRDHQHGRVYRVTHRDRELRPPVAIADQPIEAILEQLKHRDNGIRNRAKTELSARDEQEVIQRTADWLSGLDPNDPMHEHHLLEALWVHQHHHLVNDGLLRALLQSQDYRVRAAAANVLRVWREEISDSQTLVEALVHDDDPRVRLMAVLICSDMGTAKAAEIALEAARYPCDRFLQYALRVAVQTLAPYWKQDLESNVAFCEDNPDAIEYLLAHANPDELLKLRPHAAIFAALLNRKGIPETDLRAALLGLAKLEGRDPLAMLVEMIRDGDPNKTANLGQWVKLLAGWKLEELKQNSDTVQGLLNSGGSSLARQAALAAQRRIGTDPSRLWELAKSRSEITDLLGSIPLIPEKQIRAAYFEPVRGLLDRPQDQTPSDAGLRRAAITALAHIPGHETEKIQDLTRLLREGVPPAEIVPSLQSVPAKRWNRRQAEQAIKPVIQYIAAASVAARASKDMAKTIKFARQLASRLPAIQQAEQMERLESLSVTQLNLKTVPHRMAYDQEKLAVPAGRAVRLNFRNLDDMPHNFVLIRPGGMEEVGLLAEATAATPDVAQRHYVPQSDQVLVSSKLVNHRQSDTVDFMAPQAPGVYPYICTYPGHWRRMFGALYVVEDIRAYQADPEKYLTAHPLPIRDDLLKYNRPQRDWTFTELEPALASLSKGAAFDQGKKLFTVANCVACHRLNDEGIEVGPDLAKLDAKRKPVEILRSMLDPSNIIVEDYQAYSFFLDSGATITGLIGKETEEAYHIVVDPLASCEPLVVPKKEVEEQFKSSVSIMPNGLLDRLTEEEILQLVAYIVARGRPDASVYAAP